KWRAATLARLRAQYLLAHAQQVGSLTSQQVELESVGHQGQQFSDVLGGAGAAVARIARRSRFAAHEVIDQQLRRFDQPGEALGAALLDQRIGVEALRDKYSASQQPRFDEGAH